eukprot:357048-Chlamydomonas_euryale.AAC.1
MPRWFWHVCACMHACVPVDEVRVVETSGVWLPRYPRACTDEASVGNADARASIVHWKDEQSIWSASSPLGKRQSFGNASSPSGTRAILWERQQSFGNASSPLGTRAVLKEREHPQGQDAPLRSTLKQGSRHASIRRPSQARRGDRSERPAGVFWPEAALQDCNNNGPRGSLCAAKTGDRPALVQ